MVQSTQLEKRKRSEKQNKISGVIPIKATSKFDVQKTESLKSIYNWPTYLIKYAIICLSERMRKDLRSRFIQHLQCGGGLHDFSKKPTVKSLEPLQQQTPTVAAHPHDSNTKPPINPSYRHMKENEGKIGLKHRHTKK